MKHAYWLDWWDDSAALPVADRLYFGHETCEHRMPPVRRAREICRRAADAGLDASLVLPCLTDRGLDAALHLVERLLGICADLEVVSSDWGLIKEVNERGMGVPVLGRALAAQNTDPRTRHATSRDAAACDRQVTHLDGTVCDVQRKVPSATLVRHHQSCWIDRAEVVACLQSWGVHRCELSNTAQGIALSYIPGWTYSLHVPDVLITIMRYCPGTGEDFDDEPPCSTCSSRPRRVAWQLNESDITCSRRDNAIYYRCDQLPQNLADLPIDRLVHWPRFGAAPVCPTPSRPN